MDISELKPGDEHYMAYVGPPAQYDVMGAMQFRLLCTLGLRAHHSVLDFGCGSLRSGRLFISYLDPGRYFGIEPNKWLIEDAVKNQIGEDQVRLKRPRFDHNAEFMTDVFSQQFDFIIAQSIFSHAGSNLIRTALRNFKNSLQVNGLIAVTFIEGNEDFHGNGWVYPGCVRYRPSTIEKMAQQAGMYVKRIPWYHPRQTWYLFAHEKGRLPDKVMMHYLEGAVLFDHEFTESWKRGKRFLHTIRNSLKVVLPQSVRSIVRKFTGLKKKVSSE